MSTELKEIVTADGLIHQGFYVPGRKTALLWIHALGNAFYHGIARHEAFLAECAKRGFGYAAFNNRGHDLLTSSKIMENGELTGKRRAIGSSVEHFKECVPDIGAAVGFLASEEYDRIILVGYSSGANKACFYAASAKDPRVSGIVLVSPLNDRLGMQQMPGFGEALANMKSERDAGKGDVLYSTAMPFPMTPNRFLSLFEAGSMEDVFDYDAPDGLAEFSGISAPVLVVLAGADEHADRPAEQIRKAFDRKTRSGRYKSVIVEGADHGFTGKEPDLARLTLEWAGKN